MAALSIFGATPPPGVYTLYNDGAPGLTLGQQFGTYGGLLNGAACVGARLYVPSTAPAHTNTVKLMAWLPGKTLADAPDREVTVGVGGSGWVEGLWPTPLAMPADGQRLLIGYQFTGTGLGPNHYIHTPGLRGSGGPAIPAFGDVGLELSAAPSAFLRFTDQPPTSSTATTGYGLDILVEPATVVEPPPNQAPVARAGVDQVVASQASVTISGSTSSDADGTLASYTWAQTSGPTVVLSGSGAARTFQAPEGPATLSFRLTVTDDDGATSQDTMVVTVQAPPTPPPSVGAGLLTDADLAYMREVQSEARPTEAELIRQTQSTTPSGGRGNVPAAPEPIRVRLDGQEVNVPNVVASIVGSAKAVKVVMDMVEVRVGDIIRVLPGEEYQVITGADPDRWRTAQVVWAKRIKEPSRG